MTGLPAPRMWMQRTRTTQMRAGSQWELLVLQQATIKPERYRYEVRVYSNLVSQGYAQTMEVAKDAAEMQFEAWLLRRFAEVRGVPLQEICAALDKGGQ